MKLKPPPLKNATILGTRVDLISPQEILSKCTQFMTSSTFHHVITANTLLLLEAERSSELRKIFDEASLVTPESSGIAWAASYLKLASLSPYPGIDLAYDLCAQAAQKSVPLSLFGGKPGVADKAAQVLKIKIPGLQIKKVHNGFGDAKQKPAQLVSAGLNLVALGTPHQEKWIFKNRHKLPPGCYIGVGGSFDVWAGQLKRAPAWFQKRRIEWLYRWGQQPSRWPRMTKLPLFAAKIMAERYKN